VAVAVMLELKQTFAVCCSFYWSTAIVA